MGAIDIKVKEREIRFFGLNIQNRFYLLIDTGTPIVMDEIGVENMRMSWGGLRRGI